MNIFNMVYMVLFLLAKTRGEIITYRPESIFPLNYNKFEPPSTEGNPIPAYVSIILSDVDNIDEDKMEYSMQIFFTILWKDERLNLSSYLKDNTSSQMFPSYLAKHIWEPDIVFVNAKYGRLHHLTLPNIAYRVMEEGSFTKEARYTITINCPMDLQLYPMDTQNCVFKMASLSFTDARLKLHWSEDNLFYKDWDSVIVPYKVNLLKYELIDVFPTTSVDVWPEGNYTFLNLNFKFVRTLTGAIFNVYVPSTLVVLLSWISFWVDVEAVPARITLGVTSLLTLTTQIAQVHGSLPPLSYLTAMDVWLFGCLIGVFFALVEFAFAYQFFLSDSKVTDTCSLTRMKSDEKLISETNILKNRIGPNEEIQSSHSPMINRGMMDVCRGNKNLDEISRKAFPLLFLIFSLVYWIYFLGIK